jgi:sugar phosphate isomerase/epimerase
MMRIGFIGVNDLPGVEEDARFAAEHGFEGIEFNYWHDKPWGNFDEDVDAETIAKMRGILDKHGVRASALGLWGSNHISPDPVERQESLNRLEQAIEFAKMLGASILITGGGQIPDASLEENVVEFVKVFPPFVERAQKAGLKIALYAVHGDSFFDSAEAYERVWEHIPDVGIKLDCANIQHHGDEYLPILRDHGDRVFHVHIKEHLYMDGELASQPAAGMGDIEWGKIMAFLYEHAYDGYLSIEPHGPIWGHPPLRRTMLLLSQRYIRQFLP